MITSYEALVLMTVLERSVRGKRQGSAKFRWVTVPGLSQSTLSDLARKGLLRQMDDCPDIVQLTQCGYDELWDHVLRTRHFPNRTETASKLGTIP